MQKNQLLHKIWLCSNQKHEVCKGLSAYNIWWRVCIQHLLFLIAISFKCHHLFLKSVQEHVRYFNISPFRYDFKGIIDYIFFSRDHLKLLGVLGPLEEEWIQRNKIIGCPQPHVPSDHFSLFVEFELPIPYPGSQGSSSMHNKLR